jgi:hypothetical protein
MRVIMRLHWPLILGLGALAMIHPLVATIVSTLGSNGSPALSIMLSVVISAAWIGVVGLTRVRHPVLTLVFAALTYAVFSTIFSGIVSPFATGRLQGPMAMPPTIIAVLITNAIWGAVTGLLALALQRARGFRPERTPD